MQRVLRSIDSSAGDDMEKPQLMVAFYIEDLLQLAECPTILGAAFAPFQGRRSVYGPYSIEEQALRKRRRVAYIHGCLPTESKLALDIQQRGLPHEA
eukprot:3616212-Amphidinium_carterae.1